MKKLSCAFIWEWDRAKEIYPLWRDGLRACVEEIEKKHNVDWLLFETPKKEYDWILAWSGPYSNFSRLKSEYSAKRGLFLTTMPDYDPQNLQGFDAVFCESTPVKEAVRALGVRAVKAFGTDSDFFCPDDKVEKDIEYFYPATFSKWKMQSRIAHLGDKLLCLGTVQPDGQDQLEACKEKGVQIEIGYFPVEKIRNYYRRAKSVIIPAVHGSERTVLEAMSMDILPEVTEKVKNRKTYSYIDEYEKSGCKSPREFILKNYTASHYAKAVLGAINEKT